jgi:RHS repeat-associated protein
MEYIYDAQNRLIQVKKNTTLVADFVYDGDDGRVQKTTYVVTDPLNHTSGALLTTPVVTKYVGELYEEASNVGTKFVYLGSRKIAAVSTADSSIMFYQEDHLGGTNITTDINGLSKEVIEYDPYGKIVRDDSTLPTANLAKSQFTGKKIDDETGLYYYGARYYDPSLGRFITPDTIVQSPANPQTLNRYSYCGNNPVNRIDPSGHSWKKFWKRWGSWISPIGYAASTGNWSQLAILAVTVAANFLLPGIGTLSNVYLNIGAHALVGAAQGALVGGITSIIGGGSFGDGARLGAITGGITGALQGIGGSIAKANAARNASVNAGSAPSTGVYKAGDLTREFNSMQADVFEKVSAADKLMKWANNTNDLMKELGGLQDSWSPFDFVGGGGLGKSLVRSGLNAGENAVFYTGGNIAKQNAMAYARSIGAKTILDTPIGKALEIFKAPDALWKYSSSVYANSATGVAHVFVGEGASWSRTFASTEAGILEKNGIEMIFH